MTDTPTRLFIARYDNGRSPRYEVVPEGAMGAEEWIPKGAVVRVKALEWAKHPTADIWRAQTMIGEYEVSCIGPTPSWRFGSATDMNDRTTRSAVSEKAAKAAAQADYEVRIRAALELTTEPEPTSGWQPIETAPRCEEILGFWQYVYHGDEHRTCGFEIGEVNEGGAFVDHEGQHDVSLFTHWQPLPTPPGPHDGGTPTSGAYDLICCTAEDVATGRGFTGDAAADLAMAQESLRACLKLLGWRG